MHDNTDPAYFSTGQLADRWGISKATLIAARREGRGPRHVRLGGSIRYGRDEVLRIEKGGGWR